MDSTARNLLAFALKGACRGEDLFGQVLRGVGLRRRGLGGRGLGGAERLPIREAAG